MPVPETGTVAASTLDGAIRELAAQLTAAGLPDAALDARIFVEEAAGLDRSGLLRDGARPLTGIEAHRLDAMLARRLGGEPVWRILGRREFWGLPFTITPDVLDPRPDTETIVEAGLAALPPRPCRILDLGTGSGAILGALLSERRDAWGVGIDRSLAACRVARTNLDGLDLSHRALVVQGDWAAALVHGRFDLIVSNPPYIETDVIPTLAREVRDHDPHAALDGGSDGLACYRALAACIPALLVPGHGVTVLEVGAGQAEAVEALLREAGLRIGLRRRDLGGIERAVVAQAP